VDRRLVTGLPRDDVGSREDVYRFVATYGHQRLAAMVEV
jgi:hypothetical protein